MLKRGNWRALQGFGATPAKPIQLSFVFSSALISAVHHKPQRREFEHQVGVIPRGR
jgi:hypothetical protein